MIEMVTQAGAELCIYRNNDGTFNAVVGVNQGVFAEFQDAINWACAVRDGEQYVQR